jgi:hypothetical protein
MSKVWLVTGSASGLGRGIANAVRSPSCDGDKGGSARRQGTHVSKNKTVLTLTGLLVEALRLGGSANGALQCLRLKFFGLAGRDLRTALVLRHGIRIGQGERGRHSMRTIAYLILLGLWRDKVPMQLFGPKP